jgi:hypothetical protein
MSSQAVVCTHGSIFGRFEEFRYLKAWHGGGDGGQRVDSET